MSLLLLAGLLWASPLKAAPLDDLLEASLKDLQAKNYSDTRRYLERATRIMPDADSVVPYTSQTRLWYYSGLVEWYGGDRNQDALENWRQVLMIDPEFQWDMAHFADDEPESVFESLRREVNSRAPISLGLPESTGSMKVFVGGKPVNSESQRVEGKYLLQVVCSDGEVFGRWWKYGKPPKYETLCPDGFGPTPVPVAGAEPTGLGLDDYDVGPTGLAPMVVAQPVTPEEPAKSVKEKRERGTARGPASRPLFFWGGLGMMAAGGGVYLGLANPAWGEITAAREDPRSLNLEQAGSLSARYNAFRFTTLGLLGVGCVGVGTSFVLGAPVSVGPGGVSFHGSF